MYPSSTENVDSQCPSPNTQSVRDSVQESISNMHLGSSLSSKFRKATQNTEKYIATNKYDKGPYNTDSISTCGHYEIYYNSGFQPRVLTHTKAMVFSVGSPIYICVLIWIHTNIIALNYNYIEYTQICTYFVVVDHM